MSVTICLTFRCITTHGKGKKNAHPKKVPMKYPCIVLN